MRLGRRGDVGYKIGVALTEIGGGAGMNIRPPLGETWRVISWRATYATDATVVNRHMMWHIYDGTNFGSTYQSNIVQAASLSYVYGCNPCTRNDGFLSVPYVMLPWDMDVFIDNTWYLFIDPDGTQAGDHFSQSYAYVEKWLDE